MMRNKNIVLVGFMGCGKSTIAKKIAKWLDYTFVDIDKEIEAFAKMTIPHIFERYGEEYFRELESQIVKKVSRWQNCCMATGGGIIKNPKNIYYLKRNGKIVYLNVSPQRIYENTKHSTHRPLLNVDNRLEQIQKLLLEREHLYVKYSDIIIDVLDMNVEECAYEVISAIRYNSRYHSKYRK